MSDEMVPGGEFEQLPVVRDALSPATAPPPVPAQRSSHVNAAKLESEKVVVASPFSFAGSAARIWKLTGVTDQPAGRIALGIVAVWLIGMSWIALAIWQLTWLLLGGVIFFLSYRLVRRGQRKRKREALMHRETLAALERRP